MGGDQGQVPRREHGECRCRFSLYYQLKVDSQLFDFEALIHNHYQSFR